MGWLDDLTKEEFVTAVSIGIREGISALTGQQATDLGGRQASDLGTRVSSATTRETDVSEGERATVENLDRSTLGFLNAKDGFDAFRNLALSGASRSQTLWEKMQTASLDHYTNTLAITQQALEDNQSAARVVNNNAISQANLENAQKLLHSAYGGNILYNLDEQAALFAKTLLEHGIEAATVGQIMASMVSKVNAEDK